MQKNNLVKIINKILRDPWSIKDIKEGKDLQCMPAWTLSVKEVIPLYLEKGWLVKKKLAITSKGRHLSLNFKHPQWDQKTKSNKA